MTKRRKTEETVKRMPSLQAQVETIANREAGRTLQKGDRVQTTKNHPSLPIHTPGTVIHIISNDYSGTTVIDFHPDRGDMWLVMPADLERIAEQDSEEIE